MNVLNFDSEHCRRVRRQLDAYLSNELLVETTSDVLRHLESCQGCAAELDARTRVRDALRKAASSQVPPEELRQSIQHQLRKMQPGLWVGSRRLVWAAALMLAVLVAGMAALQWLRWQRGKQLVAAVLALGVSDHLQCAIQGHNYPNVPNPPEQLRQHLGPEYAGLLAIVQRKLPGFEVMEAHVCSTKGSSRKYVHFITRGRGTILSVILTRSDGARFPQSRALAADHSGGVAIFTAHLDGMNAAGFQSREYFGFVVSDLNEIAMLQIAGDLAPPLKSALDAGSGSEARGQLGIARALQAAEKSSMGKATATLSCPNPSHRNPRMTG